MSFVGGISCMESILEDIKEHFSNDNDFFIMKEHFVNAPVVLLGFKSLVDLPQTLRKTIQI